MLSPQKNLDTYFLEARRDLLEVAAMLDRYDRSVEKEGQKAEDESRLSGTKLLFFDLLIRAMKGLV